MIIMLIEMLSERCSAHLQSRSHAEFRKQPQHCFSHIPLPGCPACHPVCVCVCQVLAFILGRGALTLPLSYIQFVCVMLAPFMPAEVAAVSPSPNNTTSSGPTISSGTAISSSISCNSSSGKQRSTVATRGGLCFVHSTPAA